MGSARPNGPLVLDLLQDQRNWVRRRIEEIEFLDDYVVMRSSTFDVSLAYSKTVVHPRDVPRVGDRALLPLTLIARNASRNVST